MIPVIWGNPVTSSVPTDQACTADPSEHSRRSCRAPAACGHSDRAPNPRVTATESPTPGSQRQSLQPQGHSDRLPRPQGLCLPNSRLCTSRSLGCHTPNTGRRGSADQSVINLHTLRLIYIMNCWLICNWIMETEEQNWNSIRRTLSRKLLSNKHGKLEKKPQPQTKTPIVHRGGNSKHLYIHVCFGPRTTSYLDRKGKHIENAFSTMLPWFARSGDNAKNSTSNL